LKFIGLNVGKRGKIKMIPYINLSIDHLQYQKSSYSLTDVKIKIMRGSTTGIVGESGSGKSTIGKCLSAAMNADEVQFYGISSNDVKLFINDPELMGSNMIEASRSQLNQYRKRVQYIYQNHRAAINMNDTVYGTLIESMRAGNRRLDTRKFHGLALSLLALVGILSLDNGDDHKNMHKLDVFSNYPILRHKIKQLSGGQMKRILILKVILFYPEVIIADEPLTGLDASKKGIILRLLNNEQQEREEKGKHLTTVMISHDVGMIRKNCENIYVMYGNSARKYGQIIEEIYNKSSLSDTTTFSVHPYTKELIAASKYFIDEESPHYNLAHPEEVGNSDKGCIYDRCPYRDSSEGSDCNQEQHLKPNKYFPANLVACHKCSD
jgi:ABC-type dipeptide/oligopeptide/nickel transport system ATPase component